MIAGGLEAMMGGASTAERRAQREKEKEAEKEKQLSLDQVGET